MIPELFSIGPFTVYGYGLFVAIGFLLGTIVTVLSAKKEGVKKEISLDVIVWSFTAGLVGARILYILTDLDYYLKDPIMMLKVWEGGLVYYGGLLLAVPVFFFVSRRRGVSGIKFADSISKGLVLGHLFGRIGCFTKGCCYGRVSEGFGLVFPELRDGLKHLPTQLFEAAGLAVIFLVLNSMKKKYDGAVLAVYLFSYGILRFAVEFLRDDFRGPELLGLSISHWISIVIAAAGIIVHVSFSRKRKHAA